MHVRVRNGRSSRLGLALTRGTLLAPVAALFAMSGSADIDASITGFSSMKDGGLCSQVGGAGVGSKKMSAGQGMVTGGTISSTATLGAERGNAEGAFDFSRNAADAWMSDARELRKADAVWVASG